MRQYWKRFPRLTSQCLINTDYLSVPTLLRAVLASSFHQFLPSLLLLFLPPLHKSNLHQEIMPKTNVSANATGSMHQWLTVLCETKRNEMVFCEMVFCEMVLCETVFCEMVFCEMVLCEMVLCESINGILRNGILQNGTLRNGAIWDCVSME